MSSLANIRQGLYLALDKQLGGPDGYQVSAYVLSAPAARTIWVEPVAVEYHLAMGGVAQWWTFRVTAFVAQLSDKASQANADQFFEQDPIRVALETDGTLGGVCDDLIVTGGSYRVWEHPNVQGGLIGGEFNVRVLI